MDLEKQIIVDKNKDEYQYDPPPQESIRKIVILDNNNNEIEIYRIVNENNKLIYGKGKIIFDLNVPKDKTWGIDYHRFMSQENKVCSLAKKDVLAFFNDGIWVYNTMYNRYDKTLDADTPFLDAINKDQICDGLTFKGWFTKKSGGSQVRALNNLTNSLFKYSSKTSIPTITLYGQWEMKTYTIRIHNIERTCRQTGEKSRSSFVYHKKRTSDTQYLENVKFGTPIAAYVESKITKPKYFSWISLNGCGNENEVRRKGQKFIGWSLRPNGYEAPPTTRYIKIWGKDEDNDWRSITDYEDNEDYIFEGIYHRENPNLYKKTYVACCNLDLYPIFSTLVVFYHFYRPNSTKLVPGKAVRNFCAPNNGRNDIKFYSNSEHCFIYFNGPSVPYTKEENYKIIDTYYYYMWYSVLDDSITHRWNGTKIIPTSGTVGCCFGTVPWEIDDSWTSVRLNYY